MPGYAKEAKPARRGAPPKVALDDLRREDACQARDKLHQATVDEYAELYKAEIKLPPIEVFEVDDQFVVVDGFHRVEAAAKAGVGFLRCKIVGKGSLDDAAWKAVSVNQVHGLRRSSADKRKAIRMALEGIGSDQSSRVIAEHVGVSHELVRQVRSEFEQLSKLTVAPTVSGKDGKRRARIKPKSKPKAKAKPTADELPSDDASPTATGDEVEKPADRYAQIAGMIQGLRKKIRQRFGANQTIEGHLEAAWRAADDSIAVDCAHCDGGGCTACKKGRTTKGAARRAKEKARSGSVAKGAKS